MNARELALEKLKGLGVTLAAPHQTPAELRDAILLASRRDSPMFSKYGQCERKKRFATEDGARKEAKRIEQPELHQYWCEYCKGWHNGKLPRGVLR